MLKKILPIVALVLLSACAQIEANHAAMPGCECCKSDLCPMKEGKKCKKCAKHMGKPNKAAHQH